MSHHRYILLPFSVLLAMSILACAVSLDLGGETPTTQGTLPAPTPPPETPTPAPTPTVPAWPDVPYEDDFSDPSSGWQVRETEDGRVGYSDGIYSVAVYAENVTTRGAANRSFDNLVIDVDTTQVSGPTNDNNDYGVICRLQPNGDGYYLMISGDGYYGIQKSEGGEFESLVDWTASDVIRQGNATNHLRAVCDGSTLALFVNGEFLTQASDSTFSDGDIGFQAESYEPEPTEIHFDNLRVSGASPGMVPTATTAAQPTATPLPSFGPITFAMGVTEDDKPIDPTISFLPGVTEVYAVFEYDGMTDGLDWEWVWLREGEEDISKADSWEHRQSGTTWVRLYNEDGLKPANYELRLSVGGELLQSGTFVIERSGPSFGSITFSAAVEEDTNQPINPSTSFPAGTTEVHATWDYEGMSPDIQWTREWYHDGTLEISATENWTGKESGRWDNYIYNTSGAALSSGNYELRVYIDDQLVRTGTFVIQ